MNRIIKKLFYETTWKCAYRVLTEEEQSDSAVPKVGEKRTYHVIEMPKGYWSADPFIMGKNGETYLFTEFTNIKKKKSVIGIKKLLPEEGKISPMYEFAGHVSYPCVFDWNGKTYMIPETVFSHTVELMECEKWPDKWVRKGSLLKEIEAVDCTPMVWEEKLYLFVYQMDAKTTERKLLLGKLEPEECRISDVREIERWDQILGRPGGNILYEKEKMIRVVQPGNRYYGEKLEFYDIEFDGVHYSERKIGEMNAGQIALDSTDKAAGVHTLNRCGNVEIIDILIKTFSVMRPIRRVLHMLGLFGYGMYDKEGRYLTDAGRKTAE